MGDGWIENIWNDCWKTDIPKMTSSPIGRWEIRTPVSPACRYLGHLALDHRNKVQEASKGLYITGNYGSSAINKADWKATISEIDYKGKLKFKDGYGWETGLGYDFGRLRTELTYGQSNNDIKSITAQINEGENKGTVADATASGDLKITNIFLNSFTYFLSSNSFPSHLSLHYLNLVYESMKKYFIFKF